ncbi:hypothetical protein AB0I77_26085 [Streptomyces sp. NPDC050619]|uniref:hypothetical protein n=1 Tax=Streptomyces sp. NPDC050619 TaxID=3157214 RepID=UPI00343A2A15
MQRRGTPRREGGEHDVEAVLDELYTTPPSDFVPRREQFALTARTAGRAEDARRIHAARRPTLAAWAANLLLRSQPRESRRFLELGQALREAYRTLDAADLKELSAQRRSMVSALTRQAAQLALDAGHRLSDTVQQDVESTLHAVLTDPDAAERWATGRLDSALTPPSAFPPDAAPAAGARPKPARPAASPTPQQDGGLAEQRRERQRRRAQAARAAEAAAERLRAQRTRQAEAEDLLAGARDRQEQARRHLSAAEQQLHRAHEELRRADHEVRTAEERSRAAAEALDRAEQRAQKTAREAEHPGGATE